MLSQPLICHGGLDADVQRDQRIVHPFAHGQQLRAAPDHLGISPLREIDLIFDHLEHRSARREDLEGREPVLREDLRNPLRLAAQRVVIGGGGAPDVDPRGVMPPQQRRIPLVEAAALLHAGMQ